MMTIPQSLQNILNSGDLRPLGLRVLMYRNKWNSLTNSYEVENTATDITEMVDKSGTLSMTLDVNEIAKYNTNNLTLTLADPHNLFSESDTVNTLFPAGYQIYGSRVYVFVENRNFKTDKTPIFNGIIRELPNYKPDSYQVDLRIVSPLEILQDTEAKDYSVSYTAKALVFESQEDVNPIYRTSGLGVGGINAVYADGVKLTEIVDYKVTQLSKYNLPALIEIVNANYHTASAFTADYYCWNTAKNIKQIVDGLLDLTNWPQNKRDVREVVYNTQVRNNIPLTAAMTVDYKGEGTFVYSGNNFFRGNIGMTTAAGVRHNTFPDDFEIKIAAFPGFSFSGTPFITYGFGELNEPVSFSNSPETFVKNGVLINWDMRTGSINAIWRQNNTTIATDTLSSGQYMLDLVSIKKKGNDITAAYHSTSITRTISITLNDTADNEFLVGDKSAYLTYYTLSMLDGNGDIMDTIGGTTIISAKIQTPSASSVWNCLKATFTNNDIQYNAFYSVSTDGQIWENWQPTDINAPLNFTAEYVRFKIEITTPITTTTTDINDSVAEYLDGTIIIALVNLTNKTVLETLEDLALISGYEFGVDRQGIFFFRPRSASTTPQFVLDDDEIITVSSIQKQLSDFATKITLNFVDDVPVEFYANSGARPTPIDRYGVQNKDIDRPDLVNYDNPELAAAIGPQLLEIYSALPKILQVKAVLNLAAELGDIVNLKHNRNLTAPNSASDGVKYATLSSFFMACKITGINYNFDKRQMTYTLRDVSNYNNQPIVDGNPFIYEYPYQFGAEQE